MQRGSPATSGAPAALYLDNRGGRRQKPLRDDADIAERGAGRAKLEDRCGRLPNRVPAGGGAVPVQGADNPAVLRAPERRWRCSRSDGRGGRWLRRDAGRRTGTATVGEVLASGPCRGGAPGIRRPGGGRCGRERRSAGRRSGGVFQGRSCGDERRSDGGLRTEGRGDEDTVATPSNFSYQFACSSSPVRLFSGEFAGELWL